MGAGGGRQRKGLRQGTAILALLAVCCSPVAAQPIPSDAIARTHIVQSGEWLYSIAKRYGLNPLALARLNHLAPPYDVRVGDKIILVADAARPASAQSTTPAPSPANAVTPQSVTLPAIPNPSPAPPPKKPPPGFPSVTVDPSAPPAAATGLPATGRTYTVFLGLRDGPRYIGDIEATIGPDGSVAINTAQTLDLLRTIIDPPSYATLSTAFAGKKSVALADFAGTGFTALYDSAKLQVEIDIPANARPSQSLEISDLDKVLIGDVARPADLSGYMNVRGSLDYVERGGATGLQQPLALVDGALRYKGLVLEGESQYAPDQATPLTRQGTRLVYDDLNSLTRWTAGDLQVQTDGFQGSTDMVGLSVLRLYNELAPQENVRPRGNRSFTLTRASTVVTFVNGQQVQQTRLDPGTYDVSNFPFIEGANDVHLQITDDAGTREALDFSIFFDRTLLKPGLTEFGAFAGFSSSLVDGDLRYPNAKPAFTGFVRHGFFDTLTAGVNVQADARTQMAGVTGLWGSPLGTIGFDLAGSHDRLAGDGYAINIGFNRLFQEDGDFRSQTLSATFEMRSVNFSIMQDGDFNNGTGLPSNPFEYEAAITYSRSFGEYTFGEMDVRYSKSRDGLNDAGSVRGTLGYGITTDANVNFSLQYATGGFDKGVSAGVQLTYRLGETSNLRADLETQNNVRRLSYQNSQGRGADAWSVSGDLESVPGSLNFNGDADYTANRAELGLAQTASYDMHGTGVTDTRTSLRAGTSIAFADGLVAVGRPIFDSFAIFAPHPTLGDAPIVVEPNPEGDLARSGTLGPALLNDMGSYSLRTVTFDVPTAPAGYDIGSGSLRAVPPYKSGYRVVVGSDYSTIVIGRLLDADGAPIPLLAGKATELAPGGKTIILFTSRDGRFGAQGLRPGRWRIDLPATPPVSYIIEVPAGGGAMVRVGDLKPSPAGEK
jgi:outer membrane usher protein